MEDLTACPICRDIRSEPFSVVSQIHVDHQQAQLELRLRECAACRHVYVNPQPTLQELAPLYDAEYGVFATAPPSPEEIERSVATTQGGRYNHASVIPGGRFIDIGCGHGAMVGAMQRLGMDAVGVEPAAIAVERAQAAGFKVIRGLLEEVRFPDDHFDVATAYHVLEHVHEPLAFLRECWRILRPGREFVIGVPNADSAVLRLVGRGWAGMEPTHVHHYRASSLRLALEQAEFEVESMETESIPTFVEAELANWLRRRFLVPFRLTKALHAAHPVAVRMSRRAMADGRGEALVAVCRKPKRARA